MFPEGTLIECTGLALSATETTGLRCRITSSDAADAEVPALYDSESQAVTCIAPQVQYVAASSVRPRGPCEPAWDTIRDIPVHALTLWTHTQGVLEPKCCVLNGQGNLLEGSTAGSSQVQTAVEDGKLCVTYY